MENPFEIILDRLIAIETRLQSIESAISTQHKNLGTTFLDVKELSKYLKLAIPTIYDKVHKREIPYLKVASKLYFSKEEIDNWLQKGKVLTQLEIEALADEYLGKQGKFRR